MLGNDVVDLGDRECESRHSRFDDRVFGAPERAAITRAGASERMRWVLWAAKEAAYKATRRLDPATIFSPRRFEVELDENLHGHVCHPSGRCRVVIEIRDTCLHAIATADGRDPERVARATARIDDERHASKAVRALALRDLSERSGHPAAHLVVARQGRIPHLEMSDGAILALSLSHHGRFVAYAGWPPQAAAETRR